MLKNSNLWLVFANIRGLSSFEKAYQPFQITETDSAALLAEENLFSVSLVSSLESDIVVSRYVKWFYNFFFFINHFVQTIPYSFQHESIVIFNTIFTRSSNF